MKQNERGRPTKYTDDMPKKVLEYLSECVDEDVQIVKQSNSEKGYEMYDNKLKVNIPTIAGLSLYLDVAESTIHKWKEEHPVFSESLSRLLAEQQKRLLNSGLSGDYNSTIAKLILSSNHGFREKSEQDITSGGKPISGLTQLSDDELAKHAGF